MDQCDHHINFSSIIYGPTNLLHVLNTIYSRKVVLGMIDQCHSETDIVNYILPYIISSIFFIIWGGGGGGWVLGGGGGGDIGDPLGTCSSWNIIIS